jgi:hypothetical protein
VHHGGVGGDGYLINMVAFYRGLRAGLTDQELTTMSGSYALHHRMELG